MKIAVSSDEKTPLTDFVIAELQRLGHETILFGPLKDEPQPWTIASEQLARSVATGQADQGVLFCYTGTGASMAANKVPGVRAALCGDAQTAHSHIHTCGRLSLPTSPSGLGRSLASLPRLSESSSLHRRLRH